MKTIPKRSNPPDKPGVYYFAHGEPQDQIPNGRVYHIVFVTHVEHRELGLHGAVLGIDTPQYRPIVAWRPGDWYGPLPEPDIK